MLLVIDAAVAVAAFVKFAAAGIIFAVTAGVEISAFIFAAGGSECHVGHVVGVYAAVLALLLSLPSLPYCGLLLLMLPHGRLVV